MQVLCTRVTLVATFMMAFKLAIRLRFAISLSFLRVRGSLEIILWYVGHYEGRHWFIPLWKMVVRVVPLSACGDAQQASRPHYPTPRVLAHRHRETDLEDADIRDCFQAKSPSIVKWIDEKVEVLWDGEVARWDKDGLIGLFGILWGESRAGTPSGLTSTGITAS